MNRSLVALLAGALFGIGLVIGRMTDPLVVLGFLDVAGAFDPTLLFVLGGAVGTTLIGFRFILRQTQPLLEKSFYLPSNNSRDKRLVAGAALFGIGWGFAGYCPGPALGGLAGGVQSALIFVAAMIAGSLVQRMLSGRRPASANPTVR